MSKLSSLRRTLASWRLAPLACGALLALAGCGGGGSSGDAPIQSGVFSDSAVAGLSYTTSSGLSGVTDQEGRFQFREGDKVTFKLAGVTIGEATGATLLTPAHITEEGEEGNRFTNLLILLQTLDTDGDPSNGIGLPANVDGIRLARVVERLDLPPADFSNPYPDDDDIVSGFGDLAELDPDNQIVSPETARKHFDDSQATLNPFFGEAAGVWVGANSAGNGKVLLRLGASGRYALLVAAPADESGQSGIEGGTLTRDATTGVVKVSEIKVDTNGQWGLSHPQAGESLTFNLTQDAEDQDDPDRLVITVKRAGHDDVTLTLKRVPQPSSRHVLGAWSTSPEGKAGERMVVFLPEVDGSQRYILVDPTGDSECATAGVEVAEYFFGKGYLSLEGEAPLRDSTGCGGLWDTTHPDAPLGYDVQFDEDGNTLTLTPDGADEPTVTLYRIKPFPPVAVGQD